MKDTENLIEIFVSKVNVIQVTNTEQIQQEKVIQVFKIGITMRKLIYINLISFHFKVFSFLIINFNFETIDNSFYT